MSVIKPKVLDWLCESWKSRSREMLLIKKVWERCVVQLYDIKDAKLRKQAVQEALKGILDVTDTVPATEDDEEAEEYNDGDVNQNSDDDDDIDDDTVRQVMEKRVFGERRSTRQRTQTKHYGYQLISSQIDFTEIDLSVISFEIEQTTN